MFENVIGLPRVTSDLQRAIRTGTLPQALLLSGPRYGGKGTIALETARALTCRHDGSWDCPCRSCSLHRTLSHSDLVLAGSRYFDLEIDAALNAYRAVPRPGTLYLLIRAVRKLVRRFDAHLWSETRIRKIMPAVDTVEEVLQTMEPSSHDGDQPRATDTARALKQLETAVTKLLTAAPREMVPIDLVRAIGTWARLSTAGGTKVIVLEEAHALHDSARNSMLKLLEEPPQGVYMILTTTRRSAIIPTILSRVRTYPVPERSREHQREVQERIFRVDPRQDTDGGADGAGGAGGAGDLTTFFRCLNTGDSGADGASGVGDRRQELAEQIVSVALHGEEPGSVMETIRRELSGAGSLAGEEFLFEALCTASRRRLKEGSDRDVRALQKWGPVIRAYRSRIETRNMNPVSTVSSLVLALQRVSSREDG